MAQLPSGSVLGGEAELIPTLSSLESVYGEGSQLDEARLRFARLGDRFRVRGGREARGGGGKARGRRRDREMGAAARPGGGQSIRVRAPLNRGWRRASLYRGDEEGFLVHGEKRKGIWKLLEMVSSPVWLLFWYSGRDREAAEVALTHVAPEAMCPSVSTCPLCDHFRCCPSADGDGNVAKARAWETNRWTRSVAS
jgi:hypothetical protein